MAAKKKAKKVAKKSVKKTAKKVAKKAVKKVAKKAVKKAVKKVAKKKTKRTPNAAFMKPVMPNEKLAALVGSAPLPRTEMTKKLWAYIRKNGLQDKKNRRMINCDDKLKGISSNRAQISMFELTSYANANLKKA